MRQQKAKVSDRLLDEKTRQAEIDALRERLIESWTRGEIDRAADFAVMSGGGSNQITFERKRAKCFHLGENALDIEHFDLWKAKSYYAASTNHELIDNFTFRCPHGQKVVMR